MELPTERKRNTMTVTVTATYIPATGLTELTTARDGVVHHVKWIDLGHGNQQLAVIKALREAVGDRPNTLGATEVTADSYALTAELR
jgi:hypothetical protein